MFCNKSNGTTIVIFHITIETFLRIHDFENEQRYDTLLFYKGLTQNSSLRVSVRLR